MEQAAPHRRIRAMASDVKPSTTARELPQLPRTTVDQWRGGKCLQVVRTVAGAADDPVAVQPVCARCSFYDAKLNGLEEAVYGSVVECGEQIDVLMRSTWRGRCAHFVGCKLPWPRSRWTSAASPIGWRPVEDCR